MTFHLFAHNLLNELERQAKRANQIANYDYAAAPHSTKAQDDAWARCQTTARLCDLADDLQIELANIEHDRRNAVRHAAE